MSGRWSGFYCKYGAHSVENALKDGQITEEDAALIVDYLDEMTAREQLSDARILKITTTLLGWRKNKLVGPFADLTMRDLYSGIRNLRVAKSQKGRPFAQNTQYDYVVILKKFLIWLIRKKINTTLDEREIKEIKNPSQDPDTTHPDEILNPDEIVAMIGACTWSRDRALIAVHYEAATRIGELSRLRWRDVIWDEYGAKLRIDDQKTKKIRNVRITKAVSADYLTAWRNDYPGTPEGDALVFVSDRGNPVTYWGLLKAIKKVAAAAGIKKPVSTHIFRISRGTHLIEQGLPESNLKEMMWGNQSTRQIRAYVRMSPNEQDRVMLQHSGIISEEESKAKERRITGKICPKCHTQNVPTAQYCFRCGMSIGEKAIEEQMKLNQSEDDDPYLIVEGLREQADRIERQWKEMEGKK